MSAFLEAIGGVGFAILGAALNRGSVLRGFC